MSPSIPRYMLSMYMTNHNGENESKYLQPFLQSRKAINVAGGTLTFYKIKLGKFLKEVNPDKAQRQDIEAFLNQFKNPGNKHAYYRALRTFFRWRGEVYNLSNPMVHMRAPKVPKKILPTLSGSQVLIIIEACTNIRDRAIIALFVEIGLRLSELAYINRTDLDIKKRLIRVQVKGGRECYAVYGHRTEKYLNEWLRQFKPKDNIWGIGRWGIVSILRRMEHRTGLPCNAHVFRRTFACLLREQGIDVLTIKNLGRWEQIDMIAHYTRSINFMDSLKFYRGTIS